MKNKEEFIQTGNKFEMTTYGYLYINNDTAGAYYIKGVDQSENFILLSPQSSGMSINYYLPPKNKLVLVGVRKDYYERYVFKIKFDSILVKKGKISGDPIPEKDCSIFFLNVPDAPLNEENFDFYFKKVATFDTTNIIEKLDVIHRAVEYFANKYPDVKLILSKVPSLDDGEEVIFRDIYELNNYSCYLGEWKVREELIKHGRGLCIWNDGSYYMGQIMDDNHQGFGVLQYPNSERIEIGWNKGVMHGKGKYYKTDGSIVDVEYVEGKEVEDKIIVSERASNNL